MEFQEPNGHQPEEEGVAIYSKWAILLFSIIFSPLIGGILLMLNLRSVGYKREGTRVLLFAIAYQFMAGAIITKVLNLPVNATLTQIVANPKFIIYTFVGQIIGGGILAEYFFKKYFPDDDYEHKSVWRPLAIIILITLALNLVAVL